jgi:regulatory protein YycI of two-component signal transduction system YycFG
MKDITFSLIEIFVSLIIETVIMGGLFTWISNKTAQQNEQQLKDEMTTIESQNKLIYQELQAAIKASRDDVISQIKESAKKGG